MTQKKFFEYIESLVSHIYFTYNGKDCVVDPFNAHCFILVYGDFETECKNIDEVKNGKYFDGKSLSEIFDDITDIEY